MVQKLEGTLKLQVDDEEILVPLEEFQNADGGTDKNAQILRHEESDVTMKANIKGASVEILSVLYEDDEVDDFDIDP